MTKIDITWLLGELEKNEMRSMAILSMIDGDCKDKLIRDAVEELCDFSESLKLACSIYEKPFCDLKINQF